MGDRKWHSSNGGLNNSSNSWTREDLRSMRRDDYLRKELDCMVKENALLVKENEDLRNQSMKFSAFITKLENENQEVSVNCKKKTQLIEELNEQLDEFKRENCKIKCELGSVQVDNTVLVKEIEVLEGELHSLKRQYEQTIENLYSKSD